MRNSRHIAGRMRESAVPAAVKLIGVLLGLAAIAGADWLAIFPGWYQGTPAMTAIAAGFQPRQEFRIPFEEYTICKDPSQTVVVVFERTQEGR